MNEFTKKELEQIHFWGLDRLEAVGIESFKKDGDHLIYSKIESMIENFQKDKK